MSWFRLVTEPILALVFVNVVKNWEVECTNFLDTDNQKLDLKVYIRHRITTLNERIKIFEGKKMMIPRGI